MNYELLTNGHQYTQITIQLKTIFFRQIHFRYKTIQV